MKIRHRNRISKDTLAKKKLILEKMKDCLQDISARKNAKIQDDRIRLSNAEKRAKQRAEYEASRVLSNDKKTQIDTTLAALIQAKTPEEKVKESIKLLDNSSGDGLVNFNIYKPYVMEMCPEFYDIMKLYPKVRKYTLDEQETLLIAEYKKYLKEKQNFGWGTPFVPEKDVSNETN